VRKHLREAPWLCVRDNIVPLKRWGADDHEEPQLFEIPGNRAQISCVS
jgi:hypothetical protein